MEKIDNSIKIAICDDSEQDRTMIQNALIEIQIKLNTDFDTTYFTSGEELCENVKTNSYDIILLDILMSGINGIETANRVKLLTDDSLIIFISSYDDEVKELFGSRIIGFIDKPIELEKLQKRIEMAKDIIVSNNKEVDIYTYTIKGKTFSVPINEIMYIESKNHNILINTTKDEIVFYGTMKTLWNDLKDNVTFGYPHKSFIVNFKYSIIGTSTIEIKNKDISISIGRGAKDETFERYSLYLKERSML